MKKAPAVLLLLAAAAIVLSGCQQKPKPKLLLIEVYSSTCEVCMQTKPVIDEIEKEYAADLDVIRYDLTTQDGFEKAKPYKSPQIPVFVFFDRDGKQFFKHDGKIDKELLVGILKSHL